MGGARSRSSLQSQYRLNHLKLQLTHIVLALGWHHIIALSNCFIVVLFIDGLVPTIVLSNFFAIRLLKSHVLVVVALKGSLSGPQRRVRLVSAHGLVTTIPMGPELTGSS